MRHERRMFTSVSIESIKQLDYSIRSPNTNIPRVLSSTFSQNLI